MNVMDIEMMGCQKEVLILVQLQIIYIFCNLRFIQVSIVLS